MAVIKKRINHEAVANPEALFKLLNAMDTETDSLRTLANELRTDHATFKTQADAVETLVEELHDDHATFKTAVDQTETLIEELHDDHATIKGVIDEIDSDHDDMNDYLHFLHEVDGVIDGDFTIATAAAVTLLGAGHVKYRIGGEIFYVDLDTTITLADDGDVDNTKWRAWRIEINRLGVVAATADGDTQHANEEDALLNLSKIAPTANTVTIGYFTINSNGGFNIGTDNTNGETAANVYHVRGPKNQVSGLHTALGAPIVTVDGAGTWGCGTINVKRNGVYLAQIAAIVAQAVDDADTIATLKFGGWLLVTNLAGTGVYLLAADGGAGAVSAMSYDTAILAEAALDTLCDRLPEIFVPIGKILVQNGSGGLFTAGATNWNAANITTTETDATVGVWDRTATTGFDSHKINPPAVPASLAAASPAALASSKPASAPATLTAIKPASAPATITAAAVVEQVSKSL